MTTMTNAKEKLAKVRELCPGMSEDMYMLTDYMSENFGDEIIPEYMIFDIFMIQDDLKCCENYFDTDYPEQFLLRRKSLVREIQWFPQVIDAIADEDFIERFRGIWKNFFGIVPPKRVNIWNVKTDKDYPSYIQVAVEWWANAIVSLRSDQNETFSNFLNFVRICVTKEYTFEDIKIFKETLARGIEKTLQKCGCCKLDVDYYPCRLLDESGRKIGVKRISGYPCHTKMLVCEKQVALCDSKGNPSEILWMAE